MYIYGASGHARVIIDLLESSNGAPISGLFDDNPAITCLLDYPVLGSPPEDFVFDRPLFLAIGDNALRKKLHQAYRGRAEFASLVHPSAIVSRRATLGPGSVVMEGALVKVNVRLGNHVIVNTAASVDHDCVLEDYVHIGPRSTLCGGIHVGEGALVGAGSTLLPGIRIGAWARVGAGSVVTRNLAGGATWIGTSEKK